MKMDNGGTTNTCFDDTYHRHCCRLCAFLAKLDASHLLHQSDKGRHIAEIRKLSQLSIKGIRHTQLGIYLEPGVRYYLDNGSQVQNFFKDQPFSWSLQFGIRLNMGK